MRTATAGDPLIDEIERYHRGRKPALVRLKYRRMAADPFAFFRGADHLYGRAWPELRPPDVGPSVWICGDLHLENFGAYRTETGVFGFDINDFDEALVAPCSLDLVRCTTSILLAAELWSLKPTQATGMALAFLESYREALSRGVEEGTLGGFTLSGGHGPIRELLSRLAVATQGEMIDQQTRRKKGGRRLIIRNKQHPEVREKRSALVREAVEALVDERGAYRVVDVTARIAGVGSLGVRRYVVLVEGEGAEERYRLLDVKECTPPCLLSCTDEPQPGPVDEAERVVAAQSRLQGHPSVGLGVTRIGERSYRVREMIPEENRASLDHLQRRPEKLRAAVKVAGRLTAWSQLRGSRVGAEDRAEGLHRWASGPALDSLLAAAVRYADRTQRDYATYLRAWEAGLIGTR